MTAMVIGVGGRGHRDWAIGPRVIARLSEDQLVHSLGIRLVATTGLPGPLIHAGPGIDKLIVVQVTAQGGPPGSVHQAVLDLPGVEHLYGAGHAGLAAALTGWGLGTLATELPRRIVVLSVEGCDLSAGRSRTTLADEAVRRVVALVMRELKLARHPRPPDAALAGPIGIAG